MDPFDKFRQTEAGAAILSFEDGPYLALCFCALGSWSWTVWKSGAILAGGRSWHMGAAQAYDHALAAIEGARSIRQPSFFDEGDI